MNNNPKLLLGKVVSEKIKKELTVDINSLKTYNIIPKLSAILVGEDPASKIYVNSKAQKTDGYQLSKAILLDENSEFNAKHELEIYADDVKCSHGSTSGSIDEDSIHYLMTMRASGLHRRKEEQMMVMILVM